MPLFRVVVLLMLSLGVSATAGAASADPRGEQKARIVAERQQAHQRYEAARKACEQRFAVTPCLEEARGQRREVLDRLAREQAVLDDAQRRQRAADRLKGIQDRARQLDDRAVNPPAARTSQRGARSASSPAPAAPLAPQASRPDPRAALTAEQSARHRAEHDERLREAAAHRAAVERRNAERAAKKPPAAPLPVPSAPARSAQKAASGATGSR